MKFNPLSRKSIFLVISILMALRVIEIAAVRPTYCFIYLDLGLSAEQRGQQAKAIRYYETASYHQPQNPLPYERLGGVAEKNAQFEKMVSYYTKAASLQSRNAEMYTALGMYFFKRQDFAKASEFFLKAVEIYGPDRGNDQLYYYQGLAYEQQGLYLQAVESFKLANHYNPRHNFSEAIYHLGISYYKAGDLLNAVSQMTALLQIDAPQVRKDLGAAIGWDDPQTHYRLGVLHYQAGDFLSLKGEINYLRKMGEESLMQQLQELMAAPRTQNQK